MAKRTELAMRRVVSAGDVPVGQHYAIISYDTICYDDGYGGQTTDEIAYHFVTEDRAIWESAVKSAQLAKMKPWDSGRGFVAFVVPALAKITTVVNVSISEE